MVSRNEAWVMLLTVVLACVAFLVSALLTNAARRFALSRGMLDVPNERSSHSQVTPRGGGIAIVITTLVMFLALALSGRMPRELCLALCVGGAAIALVGYLDDRHRLSPRTRLTVHLMAAVWAVVWVKGLGAVQLGAHVAHLGWAGPALSVLGVVWVVNLFNFMDGIDGIAASEAVCVAGGGALLATLSGADGVGAAAWVFAWASAGFLCLNWPPARVFLGDVGSGYLGYVVIVLALADSGARPVAIWEWLILGALFFVDSTVTLLRRLFRGDRVHDAHRQHAYQRLARRWGSHFRVTVLVLAVNVLWLFPCSLWVAAHPAWSVAVAVMAALPLLWGCWWLGAGRRLD